MQPIDTSDEACALVCMIVSNPQNTMQKPGWQKRVNDLIRALRDERNDLRGAARNLYGAAFWIPDRKCDEGRLWEALRDAARIEPGNSVKPIISG